MKQTQQGKKTRQRIVELENALRRIADARDSMAEHGKYPFPGPAGDQEFDDWAADVASAALGLS